MGGIVKNLLIFIHPNKKFNEETAKLVKIQIDNSLDLGWKAEDILLVTNFDYEYNGIKSIVIDGESIYYPPMPRSTNTLAVPYLIDNGITKEDVLYWVHDFDAYQMNPITKTELELNEVDVGLTTYGWSRKWCLGSFFYRPSAKDIFEWIKNTVHEYSIEDERALVHLTRSNFNNINDRYKILNITYNFGMRKVEHNYTIAEKPIKVVHFHPYYSKFPTLDSFMYGKNALDMPLMNERLIRIFKEHNIK